MNVTLNKRTLFWAAVLTLIFAVGIPSATLAQGKGKGRGRGQDKKAEKFKNGHDARDGRWDGRGPRGNRDDRYDDDDDYRYDDDDYRYERNRRSGGNNGGYYDRAEVRRRAQSIGYQEGYNAGRDDRASGRRSDFESYETYRDATAGYNDSYGDREYYRSTFREAFRQGYEDGYRNRSGRSTRSRVGTILGDILGRP
ncbi:MAG TPA: hypothetical protein VEQ40_01645 [Pyrinomonadaceae bacterium]|nr:hypothetical protein [Pyrinomonadaceae bacterium]